MIEQRTFDAVTALIRTVTEEEVVARFQRLAEGDVSHKTGPMDLVTVADRRAEERLTEELGALLPGSVVVGEEAVSADSGVLARIKGEAPVWIVDPVDGTANFVAGKPRFATLVALAQGGELFASWTYAPRLGLLATARRGQGAHVNGERVRTGAGGKVLKVATSQFSFLDEHRRSRLGGPGAEKVQALQSGCAGLDYLELARGGLDAVAFAWEAPWDHAAGLLLVTEAGGASLTTAGKPFSIAGGNALPFSAARDAATAWRVLELMDPGRAG